MLEQTNYAGPCTLTRKTEAGTGNLSIAFNSIIVSANEHADREAGLPGRVDRSCCSCGNGHNRHTVTRRGPEIMTACTCGTLGPDMDAETCEHYCGRRGE